MIYQIQSSKHWLIRKLKELSEDLNSIKMIQSDTLIEIKNNLHGKNSRVTEAQNHINDLEHKEAKTTMQNNKKNKEYKKSKDSISSLWDNCKHSNIHIIEVPEGEQKKPPKCKSI